MPRLGKVYEKHSGGPTEILGVACGNDDAQTIHRFAQEKGLRFPIAMDPDRRIRGDYRTYRVPTVVVVGVDGVIRATYVGGTDQLANAVDQTLTALETDGPLPEYTLEGGG